MIEQFREFLIEIVNTLGDRTAFAFIIIFVGGFIVIYLGSIVGETRKYLGVLFGILGFLCLVFGASLIKVYFDQMQS